MPPFLHPRSAFLSGFMQVALLFAFACPEVHAGSIHPTLREWMRSRPAGESVAVWVFFVDRAFPNEEAHRAALAVAQEKISDAALARRARVGASFADDADLQVTPGYVAGVRRLGEIRHESRWLNAVSASVPLGRIADIAGFPFVVEVRPVAIGRMAGIGPELGPDGRLLERPDPTRVVTRRAWKTAPRLGGSLARPLSREIYGPSYGQLNEIGVVQTHAAGYSGARVVLEIIDTGFRKDHHAFGIARNHIRGERDFVFHDGQTQNEMGDDPTQHWHGSATWSTSGGFDPGNIVGPAYGATFVLAKTEDIRSETRVEEDNYVAALEWGDSLGVDITSASLIYQTFDDGFTWNWGQLDGHTAPISRAIDRAAARGILCVNAMGNFGPDPDTLGEPADADSMLACGAVDSLDSIARFSSRGPTVDGRTKPEIVARGLDTWAADANGIDTYEPVSGTSLSTPLVGGACALVLEAHPEWSAFRARSALLMTADRASHPDNDYGFGRINVWTAIHQAPIVAPLPFSLVSPANGESVSTLQPRFIWNRSGDPGHGAITYELWIDDDPAFGTPIAYGGLSDTTYVAPVPLAPSTAFHWRVIAEGPLGYRRLSREDQMFRTPVSADTHDLVSAPIGWRVECAPNPYRRGVCTLRWFAPPGSVHKDVDLSIVDPAGRRLARERLIVSHEGWNESRWDGRSMKGEDVPSGIYLVLLEASGRLAKGKIVLTR